MLNIATETVFSSFALVAVSEMGDKTQLLAFSLAARYRKPIPILLGILVATILNHALAAAAGSWVAAQVPVFWMKVALAVTFFGFALWTLKPDTLDDQPGEEKWGPFLTTTVLFFLAEMGDKTQLATVALGAKYASAAAVTVGTTLGMMVSDGLAIFAGGSFADRLPMQWIRRGAALLFAIFGLLVLLESQGFSAENPPQPRGHVLLAHGLNLKPSKMAALASALCTSESALACHTLVLPGHEEPTVGRMRTVTAEDWREALRRQIEPLAQRARTEGVPLYYVGYSLGGLLGAWLQTRSPLPELSRVVLLAPALSARWYARIPKYLPFPGSFLLPSRNHPEYRANPGTSLAAYRALFEIQSEVRDYEPAASGAGSVPTLVFLNPRDELVSFNGVRDWLHERRLDAWSIEEVSNLEPSLSPSPQHLFIDEATMGTSAWHRLVDRISAFLRVPS